jgi:hypothetical protein
MKNILFVLFLTVTFAFSSYARQSSYINKVISVTTNGTEVITITETTHKGGAIVAGIHYPDTVTTNVTVSTLPQPLTERQKKALAEAAAVVLIPTKKEEK